MAGSYLQFAIIAAGSSFDIPAGTITASICPNVAASSTYTVTSTKGGVSPTLNDITNLPQNNSSLDNWDQHTVNCVAGDIVIKYYLNINTQ